MALPANPPDLLNLRVIQSAGSQADHGDRSSVSSTPPPQAQARQGFVSGEVIKVNGKLKRKCGKGYFKCKFNSVEDTLSFHGTGTEIPPETLQSAQRQIHKHAAVYYYGLFYQVPGCLLWYLPVVILLWTLITLIVLGVLECVRFIYGDAITPNCGSVAGADYYTYCVQKDVDALFIYHIYRQLFLAFCIGFLVNLVISPIFLIVIIPRLIWRSLLSLLLKLMLTDLSSCHVLVFLRHHGESRYLAYVPVFDKPPDLYFIEYDIKPCQNCIKTSEVSMRSYLIPYLEQLVTGRLHTSMLRDRRHLVVDDHICICQYIEHVMRHPLFCLKRRFLRRSNSSHDTELHEEML